MSESEISDQTILDLWKDPEFSGSYRGIKTLQLLLRTDKNIEISEHRLYKILRTDPTYLIHQKVSRNFPRRHVMVSSYGELVQADLAVMFEYLNYKYFLLLVDVFSSKVFVRPLKSKDSKTVAMALEDIFNEFGAKIYKLETDQGNV